MRRSFLVRFSLSFMVAALLSDAPTFVWPQDFSAILADPERPANERGLDASRKPEEVLKFYGVKPGEKVADIMTGRGYYAAILSQLVGEKGVVYAANGTVRKELAARFQNPLYANVKLIEGKMSEVGLPADSSLDFALIHLNYHDLDPEVRTAMNRKIFAALKPGGAYGVVDHSAKDGTGDSVRKTLHRIEKGLVVKEVTGVGFILAKEGEMLRNPDDSRAESTLKEQRGKSDRFVLRFEKPRR